MLNLSRMHDRCVYNDMLIVYKVLHHRFNITASDIGITLRQAPTISNGKCLKHFKPASTATNNTYKSRAPIQWNNIPVAKVNSQILTQFKKSPQVSLMYTEFYCEKCVACLNQLIFM